MRATGTTVPLLLISRHGRRVRAEGNQRCADVNPARVHAFFTIRVPPHSRVGRKLHTIELCCLWPFLNLENLMKTSAIAIAALLAVTLTGAAQATTSGRKVVMYQQVVPYGDLNLQNEADARILRGRIVSAARKVCGVYAALIPIELKSRQHACVEDATARAVADVNSPNLTRLGQLVVAAN